MAVQLSGELSERPSNPYSSYVASRIIRRMGAFVEDHDLGFVTGEGGGFIVLGERYIPNVAFISKRHQPELPDEGYVPAPPDLAVEIVSPLDNARQLHDYRMHHHHL